MKNTSDGRALRNDPRLNRMLDRAFDLKNLGEFDKAAGAFEEITNLYPQCAMAHGMQGHILLSALGKPHEALPCFREAVRLAPRSETASLGLFHSLWDTDKIDEALEEIKRFQLLTNWSCQDYRDIVNELNEQEDDPPKPKTRAKPKKANP